MRAIPIKMRKELAEMESNQICARSSENDCSGRITFEHAWIYGGCQINELWAIIGLCEKHHGVNYWQGAGCMDKQLNQYISLKRAQMLYGPDFLATIYEKYPKKNWAQEWHYLSNIHKSYD